VFIAFLYLAKHTHSYQNWLRRAKQRTTLAQVFFASRLKCNKCW